MLTRTIPATGESLPVIGLGTYDVFDAEAVAAEITPRAEVLRALVEAGATLVDSSPMYGRAEAMIGAAAAVAGVAAKLFYATKIWTRGKAEGIAGMEESLRRMRVPRLDLVQIHNLLDWRTHAAALRDWKAAGRVRYLGITHYHAGAHAELASVMKTRDFDFVQLNYSLIEREAERILLPLAADLGMAVIVNRPFAQGRLFQLVKGKSLPEWAAEFDCASWAQLFLKFIVAHPAVTCVIPATDKARHMLDNLGAGRGRLPDAAGRARMAALIDAA